MNSDRNFRFFWTFDKYYVLFHLMSEKPKRFKSHENFINFKGIQKGLRGKKIFFDSN